MTPEERAIRNAQSRAYAAAHREHLRAYRVEWRAKKKAAQASSCPVRTDSTS
jgi:hypothetical protein